MPFGYGKAFVLCLGHEDQEEERVLEDGLSDFCCLNLCCAQGEDVCASGIERWQTTEHKDLLACRWASQTHLLHSKVESCLHHFFFFPPRSGHNHSPGRGIIYFQIERSL